MHAGSCSPLPAAGGSGGGGGAGKRSGIPGLGMRARPGTPLGCPERRHAPGGGGGVGVRRLLQQCGVPGAAGKVRGPRGGIWGGRGEAAGFVRGRSSSAGGVGFGGILGVPFWILPLQALEPPMGELRAGSWLCVPAGWGGLFWGVLGLCPGWMGGFILGCFGVVPSVWSMSLSH